VGRRGLCGTLFVHKIAGALAEQRKTLKEIKDILKDILDDGKSLKTIGVSLSGRVQLPDTEIDSACLGSDMIEIGLGIHGESGRHTMKLTKSAELVESVLSEYLFRGKNQSTEICMMINNLGGLSNLELYLLVNDSLKYIHARKSDLGQV
jgi:dihydroxyacetone kinase